MTTFAASQDDHFTLNHQLLSNGASDAFDFNFDSQPASLQQLPHFSFGQLDSAVHSARWMAGGGNSPYNFDAPPPEQQQVSYTPPPTIGEFLQRLPEHRLPASTAPVPSAASKYGYGLEDENAELIIKPFISKLRALLDAPQDYSDCLCWDSTGTSLIISNASDRLLKVVLPESFGHSNLASFTRQLNVYGFKRLSQEDLSSALDTPATSSYSGWSHPRFMRHDTSLLHTLTPKPSRARMAKKLEKQARLEEEKRRRDSIYGQQQLAHGRRPSVGTVSKPRNGSTGSESGSVGDWR